MKEINKQEIEKSNSWPIVEAKKILKERKSFIEKKGKIVLQTGWSIWVTPYRNFWRGGTYINGSKCIKFINRLT